VVLLQSKEILLNLSMKCRNSAFNAQGSRVIIVVVQVRALKIYVEAIEACQERGDETQFTTTTKIKLVEKLVFGSQLYIFVL
jgi:predicted oxidoreductase (fatty acid repression mutant protein)